MPENNEQMNLDEAIEAINAAIAQGDAKEAARLQAIADEIERAELAAIASEVHQKWERIRNGGAS